ncbi:uncharacterized protein At5g48480-like [Bidens hawaiensis]|uniref:uncharacterized protein At5g48480-like n=1 Tax=Bidens hawaiensis TaxID=980011 RepID=UPI00404A2DB1
MATETTNGAASSPVTFTSLKPQLFVEPSKVNDAVAFYKAAFGAEEVNSVTHQKRKADQEIPLLVSAEIKLGSSNILVSELADGSTATTGLVFCLETEDIEAAVEKAVKAGVAESEVTTEADGAFCGGERVGKLKDPHGIVWLICTPAKKSADVEA